MQMTGCNSIANYLILSLYSSSIIIPQPTFPMALSNPRNPIPISPLNSRNQIWNLIPISLLTTRNQRWSYAGASKRSEKRSKNDLERVKVNEWGEALLKAGFDPVNIKRTYDVFLSFRGEDTRKNFTDHLYNALKRAGIYTFRDNDELPRGRDISDSLIKAIRESRISIVVFSKGYASSSWCLDELSNIMICKKMIGRVVVPIFYDIDPADVRKQRGSFAEAFKRHKKRFKNDFERVNAWREALTEAANLAGFDLQTVANRHEATFIQKIVNHIARILSPKYLKVAKHPVGIDSRARHVINMLRVSTNDVHIVGISGMGGLGKTAIAKAVFNELNGLFEGSSFLFNIKETSEQQNGLAILQEQLLSDILGANNIKINVVHRGTNLIQERLCHKRVLIVLDDLDHKKQLDALVGERNWFGPGSRIVITTRNKHLLTLAEVDNEYPVDKLDLNESLKLFCLHAFKESYPTRRGYVELSNRVVDYAGGLPLALEVLGSYLLKKQMPIWRDAIAKLQKFPHHDIQNILRISFDGLNDVHEKNMFLDIACFFTGMDKDYVVTILQGCGFFPEIGIDVLVQRSLVTIDQNELQMHNLLQDMGREIVREESSSRPGKRSRLWFCEDVLNVLKMNAGTDAVEGLKLDVQASEDASVSTKSFSKMRSLRLLQISAVHLAGSCEYLSKQLRWLCWHKCPLQYLPSDFNLDSLVALDMQFSNLRLVWQGVRILDKLKSLNLSNSLYLRETPDFSGLPNLESLLLEGCINLLEVHESVGHLEKLVLLNLKGCKSLKYLPQGIYYSKSLETLDISGCSNLTRFLALEPLAYGTAAEQPVSPTGHSSTNKSKALLPTSSAGLSSLRSLDISYSSLCEIPMPIDLGCLSLLQFLNLSGCKFVSLPASIGQLPKLNRLILDFCSNLLLISELPLSLKFLQAYKCTSLERLLIQANDVSNMFLSGCQELKEILGLETVESKPIIYMENCNNLTIHFRKSLLQALSTGKLPDIVFPGSEIPDWFNHKGDGSSLSFYVPPGSYSEDQGLIVWVVYATSEEGISSTVSHSDSRGVLFDDSYASVVITHKNNDVEPYSRSFLFRCSSSNHSWVSHLTFNELQCSKEGGEELEVLVKLHDNFNVKKCGVHLIAKESDVRNSQGSVIPNTSPSSCEIIDGKCDDEAEAEAHSSSDGFRCKCFGLIGSSGK